MSFQGVGRLLFTILKIVLWAFFSFAITSSFSKLTQGRLGYTTTTEKNGFEMPSMTVCEKDQSLVLPKSFDELNEMKPKLLNATIIVKKFFSNNGV